MPGMHTKPLPAERCGTCAHRAAQPDASDPAALAHARLGYAPCTLLHPRRVLAGTSPCAHTPSRWANAARPTH